MAEEVVRDNPVETVDTMSSFSRDLRRCLMAEQDLNGHPVDVQDTRGLIGNEQEPHQAPTFTPHAPQPATQRQQPMWYNDDAEQYNSSVPPPSYPGTWRGGVSPQQQVAPQGYPAAPHSMPTPSQPNVIVVQGPPPGVLDARGGWINRSWENYWRPRCIIIVGVILVDIVIIGVALGIIIPLTSDN